jgi:hypothetical protein
MSLFSRRRKSGEEPQVVTEGEVGTGSESAPEDSHDQQRPEHGPWDATQVPERGNRIDLGALWIPPRPGMALRLEMDKSAARVVAVNLGLQGSALQVQAFAAPRTTGIWDELRQEIAASVTRQDGTADEVTGPFGTELLARLPVRAPDGRTGHRPARFLGVDGPRWFLRAVLTGRAAVDPEAAADLEAVFGDVVVIRGSEARAPRDLLPLHPPGRGPVPAVADAQPAVPDLLARGPEITETR